VVDIAWSRRNEGPRLRVAWAIVDPEPGAVCP